LHQMILENRHQAAEGPGSSTAQHWVWKAWSRAMLHRPLLDVVGPRTKSWFMSRFVGSLWGSRRQLPTPAPRTFRALWRQRSNPPTR
jgi:L-lactate dehydrogenase complex protein LldF